MNEIFKHYSRLPQYHWLYAINFKENSAIADEIWGMEMMRECKLMVKNAKKKFSINQKQ